MKCKAKKLRAFFRLTATLVIATPLVMSPELQAGKNDDSVIGKIGQYIKTQTATAEPFPLFGGIAYLNRMAEPLRELTAELASTNRDHWTYEYRADWTQRYLAALKRLKKSLESARLDLKDHLDQIGKIERSKASWIPRALVGFQIFTAGVIVAIPYVCIQEPVETLLRRVTGKPRRSKVEETDREAETFIAKSALTLLKVGNNLFPTSYSVDSSGRKTFEETRALFNYDVMDVDTLDGGGEKRTFEKVLNFLDTAVQTEIHFVHQPQDIQGTLNSYFEAFIKYTREQSRVPNQSNEAIAENERIAQTDQILTRLEAIRTNFMVAEPSVLLRPASMQHVGMLWGTLQLELHGEYLEKKLGVSYASFRNTWKTGVPGLNCLSLFFSPSF